MIRGFLRTFRGLPDARGENAPWSPVVSGRQVCQTPHMRKITHVLAVPTALVLAAGLAACKLPGTSTSSETSASEPTSTSSPAPVPTVPSIASTSGGGNVPTVPASPTPSKRSIRAADLKVSDCFSKSGGSGTEISTVDVVDCSVPHQYEVYNIYTISASTLPTGDDMETEVYTACYDSFTSYVGTDADSSSYGVFTLRPTPGSWDQGDRAITCAVSPNKDEGDTTSTLTGSVKDTNK